MEERDTKKKGSSDSMTNSEIEVILANVDKEIITNVQLGHIRGIDYSWRGKTYRWRLNSLHCALLALMEYQRHEHYKQPSFCRSKPAKKQ